MSGELFDGGQTNYRVLCFVLASAMVDCLSVESTISFITEATTRTTYTTTRDALNCYKVIAQMNTPFTQR